MRAHRYAVLISAAIGFAGVMIDVVGLLQDNPRVLIAGLAVCIVCLFVVVLTFLAASGGHERQRW